MSEKEVEDIRKRAEEVRIYLENEPTMKRYSNLAILRMITHILKGGGWI